MFIANIYPTLGGICEKTEKMESRGKEETQKTAVIKSRFYRVKSHDFIRNNSLYHAMSITKFSPAKKSKASFSN